MYSHHPYRSLDGIWDTPPPAMIAISSVEAQQIYDIRRLAFANQTIAPYTVPLARAPTSADYRGLQKHQPFERSNMPPSAVPGTYFMPMARAPTMAECDENDRRRALGLPPLQRLPPAPIFIPDATPTLPTMAPAKLKRKQKNKNKKPDPLSKNQLRKAEKARYAEAKALKALQPKVYKPPPPPTPAELRRIEEQKRLAARPWSPYVEPPNPFPPPGICTFTSHIAYPGRRSAMPSEDTMMCGTYATGPYAGQYAQEYSREGTFERCRTSLDGKHEYDSSEEIPEDSFLAAALSRREIHPTDFRGSYIDCSDGHSLPFPPYRRASQTWQNYLDNHYNPYDSDDGGYIYPDDRKHVPAYRPPSPTARSIPFKTRKLLPDDEDRLTQFDQMYDPEAEGNRKRRTEEYIGNHGLWLHVQRWNDDDHEGEPLVFVACDKVPADTLMAAAMEKGDYPESDSDDENDDLDE